MSKIKLIIASIVFLTFASGCGVLNRKQPISTNDKLMQIQLGMDRQQVISLMGNPYRREVYDNSEFLIYETDYYGKTERERFTPILLKDGKVSGFGRNYYDDAIRSKIDADIRIRPQ